MFAWNSDFLLRKLKKYSFDKNRSQLIKLDFILLYLIPVWCHLGTIIFSIFINDLPFDLTLHSKLFADDTTLYRTFDLKK